MAVEITASAAKDLMPEATDARRIRYFADALKPSMLIAVEWLPWPKTALIHVAARKDKRGKPALDFGLSVLRALPADAILFGWIAAEDKQARVFAAAAGFRRLCQTGTLVQYRWYNGHH